MNPYGAAALLLGCAAFQATFAPHLAIMGVRPNLPLVLVTSWGLLRGSAEGIWWGLGVGLATDLFAGTPLGTFATGYVLAGAAAGLGERQVFRTNVLMPMLMAGTGTLLANLSALVVMKTLDWPVYLLPSLMTSILPEMAYNIVLILLVFPVIAWLHRRSLQHADGW